MTTVAPLGSPFGRGAVLGALSLGAIAGLPLVLAIGRQTAPTVAALVALALLVPTLAALAQMSRRGVAPPTARAVLLALAAACVAPLGWFFGPNAGAAAAIALLALVVGLLAPTGPAERVSALVLVILAGGQALVLGLVLTRALPDASLAPVLVPGHPDWQHAAAHGAAQFVIVGAFFAGRTLRDRYTALRTGIESSLRAVALKDVLLAEAREEYRRALRIARAEPPSTRASPPSPAFSAPPPTPVPGPRAMTPDLGTAPSSSVSPASSEPGAGASSASTGTGAVRLWMDAYRHRMRVQHGAVLGLCLFGNAILLVIGRNRIPLLVGLVSMTCIAALAMLQRAIARRREDETVYWPWILVGALSAGPAYAFGLHSAFACVIAALLFFGGAFRAAAGAQRVGRRLPVYLAVALTHALVFSLVWSGLLPDDGNQPILSPGHAPLEPLVLHVLLQLTFAAAFVGGWSIDARLEIALREAATAEAALRSSTEVLRRTDAEIASTLSETGRGLFTGQRVGGYVAGRLIASGSQGDVYEASRLGDGGRVALKLVRWDRARDRLASEILAQEARALARISSPAVARFLEAGVDHDLPFVAMELIDGESLAEVLRARGRLPDEELAVLVRDLVRGVRDVHDAGLIHRDVKPHNVVRVPEPDDGAPRWKLVDFGLAHGPSASVAAGGTPAYVAPEQALGERVDPRADLYSTCLVVYRALTGRPAFLGHDAIEIASRARRSGPPRPGSFVSVRPELELVLRVGLAAEPALRFATARELGAALARALEGEITDAHRARGEALLATSPWSE